MTVTAFCALHYCNAIAIDLVLQLCKAAETNIKASELRLRNLLFTTCLSSRKQKTTAKTKAGKNSCLWALCIKLSRYSIMTKLFEGRLAIV
jgi:hypothetical protein